MATWKAKLSSLNIQENTVIGFGYDLSDIPKMDLGVGEMGFIFSG